MEKFRIELKEVERKKEHTLALSEKYAMRGLSKENTYLHIRGHQLYNLIAYIGDLLYRGKNIRFKEDILNDTSKLDDYPEIDKLHSDLQTILSDN